MTTQTLATWTSTLTYSSLPPSVIQAAIRSFYNWTGCTVGGSAHPASTIAHDALSSFFGSPTSTVLGSSSGSSPTGPGPGSGSTQPTKTDVQHAALLNGIASHVHDYDDTHLETIIHPTGPVAAAVLAIAEAQTRPIPGHDLITALVAGIEVECKCGLGVWPTHYEIGWHITSTTGSIGAAAAVSNLLRLPVAQTAHALGLAATQVTGLREMFGSHTKAFHPGRAAQNGLLAAVLASKGYTSSREALEAKRGWAKVVSASAGDNHDDNLAAVVSSLGWGEEGCWEVKKNSFKPFPCGIVIHPVIDGCVRLYESRRWSDVHEIEDVEVTVHPLVLELTGKTAPRDGLEAKFSVYHGAAVGLLLGSATPAQYEDAVVMDEAVVRLRGKVRAVADRACRPDECRVVVRLKSGVVVEQHVDHAVGSLVAPMSDVQLTDKFLHQCAPVLGADRARKASDWCWQIDSVANIRDIALFF